MKSLKKNVKGKKIKNKIEEKKLNTNKKKI